MKAVVKKADLTTAAQAVHNMVNPQTSMPILNMILIRGEGESVSFMASDTESCVRCRIAAQVETEGVVTVPARTFSELVRELPDTDITLAKDEEENVLVECSGVSYRLSTMDPEKFPEWPHVESQTEFTIPLAGLRRAIESVIFAIPSNMKRQKPIGNKNWRTRRHRSAFMGIRSTTIRPIPNVLITILARNAPKSYATLRPKKACKP